MSNKYNPDIHHRRSIRLKNYDYSQAGAYYVTICTEDRKCLFGKVADGKMILNAGGQMVQAVWSEMPVNYSGVEIDQFIVMPNHIHGIIVLLSVVPALLKQIRKSQKRGNHGGLPLQKFHYRTLYIVLNHLRPPNIESA